MKLKASKTCAVLLGFLIAGSVSWRTASAYTIEMHPFSVTNGTNNAPFALEDLSPLSGAAGGTINSAGYHMKVSLSGGATAASGNALGLSDALTAHINPYFLLNGVSPTVDLEYKTGTQNRASTTFRFLWDYPQKSSSAVTISFFSTSGLSTQMLGANVFEKNGGPESVIIDNLNSFYKVNVSGIYSETDAFVPGVLVPEPSGLAILATGLLMLGWVLRVGRRRQAGLGGRGR